MFTTGLSPVCQAEVFSCPLLTMTRGAREDHENPNHSRTHCVGQCVGGVHPAAHRPRLAYVSGMRSLRDVIGGNLQAVAVLAADRVTMLV